MKKNPKVKIEKQDLKSFLIEKMTIDPFWEDLYNPPKKLKKKDKQVIFKIKHMISLKDFIIEKYNSLYYSDAMGKLGNKSSFNVNGFKFSWIPEDKLNINKSYYGLANMTVADIKDKLIETLEISGFKPYMTGENTIYFLYESIRDINKKSPAKIGLIAEIISDEKLTWDKIVNIKKREYLTKYDIDSYDFNKHKKTSDGKYNYTVHFYFDLDQIADILDKPELLDFY